MSTLTCPRCLYTIPAPGPDAGEYFYCTLCYSKVPNPLHAAGEKVEISDGMMILTDAEGNRDSYSLEELRQQLKGGDPPGENKR